MSIKISGTAPVVVSEPTPPAPPEFYWIATDSPVSCLWPKFNLSEQIDLESPRGLEAFVSAVAFAQSRVLIMDPHFGGTGLVSIWEAIEMTEATVRILTGRIDELRDWLANKVRALPARTEVRPSPREFHDRFAVVDNDVWHFGSTVGGGYHRLSAATRGWHEHANPLAVLFENWWSL